MTIVLDDFHLAGGQIDPQLRFMIARSVQPLTLVVGSRTEPEIGLHRLRIDGRLGELRDADLRFDRADAAALMTRLGAMLPDGGLDAVMERTEGWAAGLQLTAIALRESPDPQDFVTRLTVTTRVVAQYLWAEVFAQQSPAVQRFLLDTCVVDELSPELAAALSPGTPVSLFDIEAANLLLHRTDPAGRAFRYHHLLRDMLRLELHAAQPAAATALHERAAEWYESRGDVVAAFGHHWRAGCRTAALRSMHGTVLDVAYPLGSVTSERERALSDEDIRSDPGPALSFAIALILNGDTTEAHRIARRVRHGGLDRLTSTDRDQLTLVEAVTALILGDHAELVELDSRLPWDSPPVGPWATTARSCVTRALVWQRQFDDAERRLGQQLNDRPTALERIEASGTRGQLHLFRGELVDAERTIRVAFRELDRDRSGANTDGMLLEAVRGVVLAETGRFAEADDTLERVLDTNAEFRVLACVLACVTLSRLRTIEGDLDGALVIVNDAHRRLRGHTTRNGIHDFIRRQQARVLCHRQSFDKAARVAQGIETDVRARHLALLEVALGRADLAGAEAHLDLLTCTAADTIRERLDVALARMELELAAQQPAAEYAEEALNTAIPDGFILPFLKLSSQGLATIQHAVRRLPRNKYIEDVLRLLPRPTIPDVPVTSVDFLSARERAVLRYLATSLSYKEIADELFVSRNTIKTHVKNISQKLGVTSRAAVIERASALRYL